MLGLAQKSVALYSMLHNDAAASLPPRQGLTDWRWRLGLPAAWRDAVVEPLVFHRYCDYEASAERVLGEDENGQSCYCHYRYRLWEMRSDDDEDYYQETLYVESGSSWRLRDGRWLTYRQIQSGGGRQGFFSFSEEMPR